MQRQTMIMVAIGLFVLAAILTLAIVAVFLLRDGATEPSMQPMVVATRDLQPNQRIQPGDVQVKEVTERPSESVLTEVDQAVGQIASREIPAQAPIRRGDLREFYEVVVTTRSVPAGARLDRSMVSTKQSESLPSKAITDVNTVLDKMVQESLASGTVLTESTVYLREEEYVVAVRPLEPNTLVHEDQVEVRRLPARYAQGLKDKNEVVGRAIREEVQPGQVLEQGNLYPGEVQLSYIIPLYKRAVTIEVANYNNLSYLLRPGDRVDLYAYMPMGMTKGSPSKGGQDSLTSDLLQKVADNVELLSLDQAFTNEKVRQRTAPPPGQQGQQQGSTTFSYQEMTLAVTLREAEKINLLRGIQSSRGARPGSGEDALRFYVMLRPRIMESRYETRRVNTYDILSDQLGKNMDKTLNSRSIEIIQGGNVEVQQVPEK